MCESFWESSWVSYWESCIALPVSSLPSNASGGWKNRNCCFHVSNLQHGNNAAGTGGSAWNARVFSSFFCKISGNKQAEKNRRRMAKSSHTPSVFLFVPVYSIAQEEPGFPRVKTRFYPGFSTKIRVNYTAISLPQSSPYTGVHVPVNVPHPVNGRVR